MSDDIKKAFANIPKGEGVTDADVDRDVKGLIDEFKHPPVHVSVRNASQSFTSDGKQVDVVKDITFDAKGRESIAILGPSGCGKSTILKMVSGMHPRGVRMPTVGEVYIDDNLVTQPHDKVLTVWQTPVLAGWHTVLGNVKLAFRPFLWGPRARSLVEVGRDLLTHLGDGITRSPQMQEVHDRSVEILKAVGLEDSMHKYPHQLSGGMRQRAALATSLVVRPSILCMDEPFSALDPTTRLEMRRLVGDLRRQYPCLILFVTHDVDEAIDMADRIIVLSTRPATILSDIRLPDPKPAPGSVDYQVLEERILHQIRDAAKGGTSHGNLTLSV